MNLETKRLILRPWEEKDVKALYELAKDEHVGPMCGWKPHQDEKESEYVLKNILMNENTWAIVCKENQKIIGDISLMYKFENKEEAELGFWLGSPYWGCGYMPEASLRIMQLFFDELGKEKLWCQHFLSNHQSARVQEKLGFKKHHINEKEYLPQLDKYEVTQVNCLDHEQWIHLK